MRLIFRLGCHAVECGGKAIRVQPARVVALVEDAAAFGEENALEIHL